MNLRGIIGIFLLMMALSAFGQESGAPIKGEVTYMTSQNVYVRFADTRQIEVGDTLFLSSANSPCLLVTNKSSSSCVCTKIGNCVVSKGEAIVFYPSSQPVKVVTDTAVVPVSQLQEPDTLPEQAPSPYKERIQGRISATTYTNLASDRDNRNRVMGQFWLDARHIKHSRFSVFAQFNYRQIFPENPENFAPKTLYFNVYNLAVRYEVSPTLSLTLGRRINPKIASLGAIDGLQVEKYFGKVYVGAIIGSRPDITNYGFNPSLLEYGAYVGTGLSGKKVRTQTTLGLIEQRNGGNTDRRYAYLQHSSTFFRNLSLFSSLELDFYQSVNGVASNTLRLTNLFVSTTYRFSRSVSLMLSYDSRKRVLFFETFQTDIERLLDDDLARQGVRARLNFRPIKYLYAGVSYSKRFQTDQQNKSDNYHVFASYSRIPWIGGRFSATYNINQSNYLNSYILSTTYSRPLLKDKLDADLYFRLANYRFINSKFNRWQYYYGLNLALQVSRNWMLRLSGERADFNQETNYRIYAGVIRRFQKR